VLKSDDFLSVPHQTLCVILDLDLMNIKDETDLYEPVVSWAKASFSKQDTVTALSDVSKKRSKLCDVSKEGAEFSDVSKQDGNVSDVSKQDGNISKQDAGVSDVSKQDENISDELIRKSLGTALYKLRLPSADVQKFSQICAGGRVLTGDEKSDIFRYMLTERESCSMEARRVGGFPAESRGLVDHSHKVRRFQLNFAWNQEIHSPGFSWLRV